MTLKRKPKTDAVKRVIDPEAIAVFSSQASNVSAEPRKNIKKETRHRQKNIISTNRRYSTT
ncbi:MAG: hypothetical protein JKY17_05185 [Magnetovibrio sp.]|nr:hypothetical protein [Magnetovibrio sp.]